MATLTRNQIIASAAGTLAILELLGRADGPLTLAQLVTASGRPKGTVHRMVSTLVNTGFATYDRANGLYALTLKAWRIGSSALRDFDLVETARPALETLRAETGETVHLSVMEPSGEIVYVAKLSNAKSIGVQTRLGQLSPSWCTATGRCLLAFHPVVAEAVLAGELQARTPQTETNPQRLRQVLQRVRDEGHAVTVAENHPEMGGVAAPIRDHTGSVVAAAGVAVPAYRMTPETIASLIPSVCRAANEVSLALGHDAGGATPPPLSAARARPPARRR
jgi:IclR family KDG regulon transcriptional repressor